MNVINLTPHAIEFTTILGPRTFPPSGQVTRVSEVWRCTCNLVDGISVYTANPGPIEGLPAPQVDTICLVSAMVLAACPADRTDVFAPATGAPGVVRDDRGQIVSVPGLRGRHE